MHDAIIQVLARHVGETLARPIDLASMSSDTELSSLGLDSISIIGILVSLSEEYGVDLGEYVDDLAAPRTLQELITLTTTFQEKNLVNQTN